MDSGRIAAGADHAKVGRWNQAGAAYLIERIGNDWRFSEPLVDNAPSTAEHLGWDVELYGDALIAAASNDSETSQWTGAAFVFDLAGKAEKPIAGDVGKPDGKVDFADFLIISANFGRTDASLAEGDIDGDGKVGFSDFLLLSNNFGLRSSD